VSKSISLFHASALANPAAAAQCGDQDTAQDWQQVADGIWDAIMEGNAAALDYLQREAGQTRAGYHPGGRWEDAREWVIASFRQHTSRDGDPQLHVHNLILHKLRRETDGQWRALDSMSLYRHRPAASAIAALAAENALTRRYGIRWAQRKDGHGREIAGVEQALMGTFSSRRQSIGPLTARLAQAPLPVKRGSLLILDEASMMSLADMGAVLALAYANDCKVVVTGDHEQLAAVEGGGGMMLLARRQGYVQLAEPQRFSHPWERDATLRLRAGDVTVLAEYEEHGRLRGGTPEEATEQACRGWLADYLDGKDTLLMARTEEQAQELSRRARDDLIRYGVVATGPHIRLAHGEQASAGDLVMARRNTRAIQAGEEGRELANRDVLQITSINAGRRGSHAEVRRLTGRDPATGQACWSEPFQVSGRYLAAYATLAYATTQHAAPGRTTSTAHVLVDGLGDRQGLYVAMSRGRDANHAYCITSYPRAADIRPGSRPAPELDRGKRLDREHAGLPAAEPAADGQLPAVHAVSVLAGVLARDGSDLSATENPATRTVSRRPPRHPRRNLGRRDPPGTSGQIRAGTPWRAARRPRPAGTG